MSVLLFPDIVQMISQYCPQVYCSLRLVSKEVKEMVDEVLPTGEMDELQLHRKPKRRRIDKEWAWIIKFLRTASSWCGFKLMDSRDFGGWIDGMRILYAKNSKKHGDRVEKFCRDYLPKDGVIHWNVLDLLCAFNRVDYVRELWNDAADEKNERFSSDCILEISMLDDLEFVKIVYEYFNSSVTLDIAKDSGNNAVKHSRWQNLSFLVEKFPMIKDGKDWSLDHRVHLALQYWDGFQHIISLQRDINTTIGYIKQNGRLLLFADEALKNDKEIIMEAIKMNGIALEYVHESLRKDRDVVMTAVKQNGCAIMFADKSLQNDKDIVLEAVKQCGENLRYADPSLRKDKEIILETVKLDGEMLYFADKSLQKDKEVVMAAVKQSGLALQYADKSLQNDKEVVMEAVKENNDALQFAGESASLDKDICMEAVKQEAYILGFMNPSLQNDKDIVLEAVKQSGSALEICNEIFRKDKEVVMEAVKQNGFALQYADESLRKDKEVVMEAVKLYSDALAFADESLQSDKDLLMEAAKGNVFL